LVSLLWIRLGTLVKFHNQQRKIAKALSYVIYYTLAHMLVAAALVVIQRKFAASVTLRTVNVRSDILCISLFAASFSQPRPFLPTPTYTL